MRIQLLTILTLLSVAACGPSDRDRSPATDLPDAPAAQADAPGDDASLVDAAGCEPCTVSGPGLFCGVQVTIDPFVTGGTFGGFQSTPGTGESSLITIGLSQAINWVSVKVIDPDFPGNEVRAYDASNALVSQFAIGGDGIASVLTEEQGGTGGAGIVRVELVPAPADYVAYDEPRIIPAGCAPIL